MSSKVLLIGWDAADWKVIDPLMKAGLMPSLQKLVQEGVRGKMATLDPPLSPMLWTGIATGKRPYKHGIHGFTEPTPDGKALRPIHNTNRQCKAIWNILSQENKKCRIVGWWPSHPAEPINGTMISNFYQKAEMREGRNWELPQGTVHPADKADFFAALRVHPHELTSAHIAPFVPEFEKVDQANDGRLLNIAKNIADSSTIHCAATYLMEHEPWDFLAVYFDAIDHFCHGFMPYHPPHRTHIPLRDYELYKDVVVSAYRFHDMLLGRYLELADEDTTILLISDHGFHPGANRPAAIPKEPTGPAIEHSPYGIIVMKGPAVKKGESLYGASLLDVTPTLLHLFDLPVGQDMDGKVLAQAFANEHPIQWVESWESIPGNDGRHNGQTAQSETDMQQELQQLIDLGYVADPGPDIEKAIKNTIAENNYNLARAYLNGQQWQEGITLLETLHQDNPTVVRYATHLISAYQIVGQYKKARGLVNHIKDLADRESPQLDLLEGTLLLAEQRPLKALELFKKVEREAGTQPQLRLRLANAYYQLNRFPDALKVLKQELKENNEEAGAWYLSGVCYFNLTQYEAALEHLLQAIGLQYYHPVSHYYLAESLIALQRYQEGADALEVCLRIAPAMNIARKRLFSVYDQYLNQPEKAKTYLEDFDQAIKGELVIVSGLPRSGTSMMMQMLEAGGLPVFTDNLREADENNRKGYLEHEEVKNLAKNKSWLPRANGKGVKIIAQLLPHLPLNYRYKIIFMERDTTDIVMSQQKMLARLGKPVNEKSLSLPLVHSYNKTLNEVRTWLARQRNTEVIYVHYKDVLQTPYEEAMRINSFLEGQLNVHSMMMAVDRSLNRESNLTFLSGAT